MVIPHLRIQTVGLPFDLPPLSATRVFDTTVVHHAASTPHSCQTLGRSFGYRAQLHADFEQATHTLGYSVYLASPCQPQAFLQLLVDVWLCLRSIYAAFTSASCPKLSEGRHPLRRSPHRICASCHVHATAAAAPASSRHVSFGASTAARSCRQPCCHDVSNPSH